MKVLIKNIVLYKKNIYNYKTKMQSDIAQSMGCYNILKITKIVYGFFDAV